MEPDRLSGGCILSAVHQLFPEINISFTLSTPDPPIDNKHPNQSTGGTVCPEPSIVSGSIISSQHGLGVGVKV